MTDSTSATAHPGSPATQVARTHSLYRKYRPQSFDATDLVGQEHIVRILRNAIRLDRISHAYLFCGPRGTGKTTTARLLAKAVNCTDPDPGARPCNACPSCIAINTNATTDVIEIDAASNRGIDDIRDLRERVKYAPVQLHTKFYIVDEAHQITGAAANAFLKTLEEPPSHTKFVLATTDPEELLPTIVSRCQRFDFRRISLEATISRIQTVAAAEGLTVDDDALTIIARQSTGSLRDGLSLLDQLALYVDPSSSEPRITIDMVRSLLGISRNDRVESLVRAIADRDTAAALGLINSAVDAGEDPRQINRQLVAYWRVLLHQRAGGALEADATARELAARFDLGQLADLSRRFSEIDFAIKHASFSHLPLEIALVQAINADVQPVSNAAAPVRVNDVTPPRPAAITEPTAAGFDHAYEPAAAPGPTRPAVSLRDRVRGAAAPPPAPSVPAPAPAAIREQPAPAWNAAPPERPSTPTNGASVAPANQPAAAAPVAAPTVAASSSPGQALTIGQLADLWPRVRQDVKAINRRVEALLASADPVQVIGDKVTLAAAYQFHRDKLNADQERSTIESVLTRIVGRPMQVSCILRDDFRPDSTPPAAPAPAPALAASPAVERASPVTHAAPPASASTGAPSAAPDNPGEDDGGFEVVGDAFDPEVSEQRLRAAINIFNAEVIT